MSVRRGRTRAKHEVAHQREAHADTGGRSIDGRDEGHWQVAQAPQKGMVHGFERRPRVRPGTRIVAPSLQVGAGAEAAPLAGHHETPHSVLRIFDGVHRFHQSTQHLGRNRVHHFRMIERQDAYIAFDFEFDPLEFHIRLPVLV